MVVAIHRVRDCGDVDSSSLLWFDHVPLESQLLVELQPIDGDTVDTPVAVLVKRENRNRIERIDNPLIIARSTGRNS